MSAFPNYKDPQRDPLRIAPESAVQEPEIIVLPRTWLVSPVRLSSAMYIAIDSRCTPFVQIKLPQKSEVSLPLEFLDTPITALELAAILPVEIQSLLGGTTPQTLTRRVRRFAADVIAAYPLAEENCTHLYRAVQRICRAVQTRSPGLLGSHLTLEVFARDGTVLQTGIPSLPGGWETARRAYELSVAETTASTLSLEDRQKKLTAQQERFASLEKMFIAVQRGAPRTLVCSTAGMPVKTFDSWLRRSVPEKFFAAALISRSDLFATALRREDTARALIIGMLLANRHGAIPDTLIIRHAFKAGLKVLSEALTELFPEISVIPLKGDISRSGGQPGIKCNSVALARSINLHTENGTQVPWHLLGTNDERLAFLRGLFTFAGTITGSRLTLSGKTKPEFLVEVSRLLTLLDMPPTLTLATSGNKILIGDHSTLRELLEHNVLIDPLKRRAVEQIVKLAERKGHLNPSLKTFRLYNELRAQNPDRKGNDLAQELGVGRDTVYSWDRRLSIPRALVRQHEALRVAERFDVPDPDLVSHLFRDLGFDRFAARRLTTGLESSKLRLALKIGKGLGWDLHRDPILVLTALDRFNDLHHEISGLAVDPETFARQAKVVEWARDLGIVAPTFGTLKGKIVEHFLMRHESLAQKVWMRVRGGPHGVEFDEVRSLMAIQLFNALERFDPGRGLKFITFAARGLEMRLYDAIGKFSAGGKRINQIAATLRTIPQKLTIEQIMALNRCTRSTAIAALSKSQAIEKSELVSNDDLNPIAHAVDPSSDALAQQAENDELIRRIMSSASPLELRMINAVYFQGRQIEQVAQDAELTSSEVEQILQGFVSRMRNEHG